MGDYQGRSTIVFFFFFPRAFASLLLFAPPKSLPRSSTSGAKLPCPVVYSRAVGQRANVNVYKRLMETTICSSLVFLLLLASFLLSLSLLRLLQGVCALLYFFFSVSGSLSLSVRGVHCRLFCCYCCCCRYYCYSSSSSFRCFCYRGELHRDSDRVGH